VDKKRGRKLFQQHPDEEVGGVEKEEVEEGGGKKSR